MLQTQIDLAAATPAMAQNWY